MRYSVPQIDAVFIFFLVIINSYYVKCDRCGKNEVLSPKPLRCEPTCTDDCASVSSRSVDKNEPTCVCLPGFVRHKGRCIRKVCCPKKIEDNDKVPPTAETTTVVPTTSCSTVPSQTKLISILKAEKSSGPEIPITENGQLIYIFTINAYPGKFYRLESAKQPKSLSVTSSRESHPTEEEPELSYPMPCSGETTREEESKRFGSPDSAKDSSSSSKTVPRTYVVRPPKYNELHELVFSRPCYIPNCEDCISANRYARPECFDKPNCDCASGYILHKGKCIRKEQCPFVGYDESDEIPVGLQDSTECFDDGDHYVESEEYNSYGGWY